MAGSLKLDGNEFLVKEGGQFKITNSELKLKSSGNTVVDSSGNAVISESGGTVTLNKGTVGSNVVFPAGHVIQVVNYTETTSFEQTLDSNLETLTNGTTNFGVNITPKVTGSKTLIMVGIGFCFGHNVGSNGFAVGATLRRDSTDVKVNTSNRYPQMTMRLESLAPDYGRSSTFTILDETANTKDVQVAYTLAVQRHASNSSYILTFNETNSFSTTTTNMHGYQSSTSSHFIAMEIAQ